MLEYPFNKIILAETKLNYTNNSTSEETYTVFNNDIVIKQNGTVIIQIWADNDVVIKAKLNDETINLNEGVPISADGLYEFSISVIEGDTLNILIPVPANTSIKGRLKLILRR